MLDKLTVAHHLSICCWQAQEAICARFVRGGMRRLYCLWPRRDDALVAWVAHRATHADTREFRDSDGFTMDERAVKTAESFRDAVDVVFEGVLVLF